MRIAALALIVVTFALALAGCGSKCGDLPGTVATVNGKAISCGDFATQMNARAGRDVLTSMIQQDIINQWAEKAGVAPTDSQIEKQIKLLKDEGQYDDQVQALGENVVKNEVRNAQARVNLAKKFLKITDQEVEQTYNAMKAQRFVHGPRKFVAVILNPDKSKLEEAQTALKDGKNFDEVARKYDSHTLSPRPPAKMWTQESWPAALLKTAKETKEGETSAVVTLSQKQGPTSFVIIKVLRSQGAVNKALADVREDVVDTIAVQKSQYDPDFIKKLQDKMKSAKIEINIPQYKDLTEQFKEPPEQSPMMPGQR